MRSTVHAIALPAMGLFLSILSNHLIAQNNASTAIVITEKKTESPKALSTMEQQPRFPGCEISGASLEQKMTCAQEKLEEYIRENLQYPEISKNQDFKPVIVRVRMTVDANGRIHSPRILELGTKEFDANALAVCSLMEKNEVKWIPGSLDGIAVRTPIMVTVHFSWEGRNKAFPGTFSNSDDIFELPDEVPAFPSCKQPGNKDAQILECSLDFMADFFNRNMVYPEEALRVGLEGDIQAEFVVGKDGKVKDVFLKNDIGLGCREEAERLFALMNEKNIGWIPGEEDNQKVNVLLKTSVRFRIKPEEKPAHKLAYMDPKPLFITGKAGFEEFLKSYLKYPAGKEINPCALGVIDVKFKINRQTGALTVTEMVDYNNLGKEFKNAVNAFLQETTGQWRINFPGLGEETQYFLSLPFMSGNATCGETNPKYKELVYKSLGDAALTTKPATLDLGMDALDKAIRLFPADNKIRHLRGTALYNVGRTIEGCVDLYYVNKQNRDIAIPEGCK